MKVFQSAEIVQLVWEGIRWLSIMRWSYCSLALSHHIEVCCSQVVCYWPLSDPVLFVCSSCCLRTLGIPWNCCPTSDHQMLPATAMVTTTTFCLSLTPRDGASESSLFSLTWPDWTIARRSRSLHGRFLTYAIWLLCAAPRLHIVDRVPDWRAFTGRLTSGLTPHQKD